MAGILPDDIIYRKKQGFGVPVYDWFFTEFGEKAKTEIGTFCNNTGIFQSSFTKKITAQQRGDKAWFLLNFAMWHKQYLGH